VEWVHKSTLDGFPQFTMKNRGPKIEVYLNFESKVLPFWVVERFANLFCQTFDRSSGFQNFCKKFEFFSWQNIGWREK